MGFQSYRYVIEVGKKVRMAGFFRALDDDTARKFTVEDVERMARNRFPNTTVQILSIRRVSGFFPKNLALPPMTVFGSEPKPAYTPIPGPENN